jgi:uncharacterized protein
MQSVPPPSISTCLQLMEEYAMLPHIREHSFIVARVADTILHRLLNHAESLTLPSKNLVIAGALLHDIAKTPCLNNKCDHAEEGAKLCHQLGFPEIAEIVKEHVRLFSYTEKRYKEGIFLAKDIIFYADKRVNHSSVVDLNERLAYILDKYGNNEPGRCQIIKTNFQKCQNLEGWLCRKAKCNPADLANLESIRLSFELL